MKNQALQCLSLSLVGDSNVLKNVTTKLTELAKQPSFCITMMEIADDQTQEVNVRMAALVQLKNCIRKYWKSQQFQISEEQKQLILNALIPAFIQSSSNFALIKIYRQIITNVVNYAYKSWLPIDLLINKLNSNENSIAVLHIIIAIQTNFQLSIYNEERQAFYTFFKSILPTLWSFVEKNANDGEVIYLVMKIIWKLVHYQVSQEIKGLLCNWMNLILTVCGASNQQLQANIDEEQKRGTVQFFYFHAKKWATRILYRFISRHASASSGLLMSAQVKQQNKQFAKHWFDNFGARVIDTIVKQFLVPSIKKTRFFQLKCLTQLINQHPQQMKQYSQSFQYTILPHYLQLQPEDQQIANNDPLEFINKQSDLTFSYTMLKRQAKEAWVAFTNIGAKRKKKKSPQQLGVLFNQNMKWIKMKLQGSNPLQKQMAMYLVCQLRSSIKNCEQVKQILPAFIIQYVIPQFTNDIMFLRARSMQIFDEYGDLLTDTAAIKKAVEGVYFCLTQDNYPLVRLKAAGAFHVLLQHQQARKQVKLLFKQILQIYLLLLQKYDSQTLVYSLSGIVQHFKLQISPYATELIKYLGKHFIKLFNKDKLQAEDPEYDGQTQLAAAGVLGTMKTLLQSPIDEKNIVKMQGDILDVCDHVFSGGSVDYVQDLVSVLRVYTSRVTVMTERLIFYYVLLIYYVVGIDKNLWQHIPNLPIPQVNRKALNEVRSGCNIQSLDSIMLVLRNYIAIDTSILFKVNDPFGENLLQLLFKMVNQIYQKGPDQFQGQVQMNSCTILMAYLLENNHRKWDQRFLTYIWQVVQFNLNKARSKILKTLNAQLICLLIWNNPQQTLQLAKMQNLFDQTITCILNCEHRLKQQYQRQRIILGLNQLIAIRNTPEQMIPYLPKVFNMLINLINKNCDFRLDDQFDEHYETQSQEDEQGNNDLNFDEDQPEDIWQQDFQRNYPSKLNEIDEIKQFKTKIHGLQQEQNALYQQLIAQVPPDDLIQLQKKITKAIEFASDGLQAGQQNK